MNITRSSGIDPGYPVAVFPLPGGGYSGITEELDSHVQKAAEDIVARFGVDVEIRFNSDRKSGGAFVKNPSYNDAGFGIGVRLYDGEIYTTVKINHPILKDKSLATDGQLFDPYYYFVQKGGYSSEVMDKVMEMIIPEKLAAPRPEGTHVVLVKLQGTNRWQGLEKMWNVCPRKKATSYEENIASLVCQRMIDKSTPHQFRVAPRTNK